ncbi:MAG: hypothetical protein AAF604_23350 [Acidobacteriota bacterium]
MSANQQVMRWSWRLKDLLRERGLTQRWVEGHLGWASGYLSQLLAPGPPALKVQQVLEILTAIEVTPAEFFSGLYGLGMPAPGGAGGETWTLDRRQVYGLIAEDLERVERRQKAQLDELDERLTAAINETEQRLLGGPEGLRSLVGELVRQELVELARGPRSSAEGRHEALRDRGDSGEEREIR